MPTRLMDDVGLQKNVGWDAPGHNTSLHWMRSICMILSKYLGASAFSHLVNNGVDLSRLKRVLLLMLCSFVRR